MALRKIIEAEGKSLVQTDWGVIESGTQKLSFTAYIKVISVQADKSQMTANVNFKGDNQSFNKQYQISVSIESGSDNFIAQAYNHLKTLDEFSNAVDC